MTFLESVISSSIGAFVGFLGALIIFFVKEWWQTNTNKTSIIENLKLELTYNITLYNDFEQKVQECIEAISNDSKSVYLTLDYDFIGTHFAIQFYRNGLLLKYFHPEDMRRWNVMLTLIGEGAEKHVVECVDQWRDNEGTEKENVYRALNHEKKQLAYAREMSQYILKKL